MLEGIAQHRHPDAHRAGAGRASPASGSAGCTHRAARRHDRWHERVRRGRGIEHGRFDGSGSSGSGLRYGLDFGDGAGVDQATGSHVYQSGNRTFRVRLIVTDSLGRTDTATADVRVKSVTGSWSNSIYNANARRYESRTLNIAQQTGNSVTGQYTHPEGWTTPFTGEVLGSCGARLNLTDGTLPSPAPISTDSTAICRRCRSRCAGDRPMDWC